MDIEINIENTSLESSRLSELDEMESRCLANTINFETNTSLCKIWNYSGPGCGQVCACVLALGGRSQMVTRCDT